MGDPRTSNDKFLQYEDEFFRYIFPIFRGIGLLISYMGVIAMNVYVWKKYNVNY